MMSRRIAQLSLGLASILALAALVIAALSWPKLAASDRAGHLLGQMALLIPLTYSTVGALLASRQRGNWIAWIFCWIGLVFAIASFTEEYAFGGLVLSAKRSESAVAAAWVNNWIVDLAFPVGISVLLLVFPGGQVPRGRSRALFWLAISLALASVVTDMFTSYELRSRLSGFLPLGAANPLGVLEIPDRQLLWTSLNAGSFLVLASSAVALVLRVRGSEGELRRQLMWLAYVAGLIAVGATLSIVLPIAFLLVIAGVTIGIPAATAIAVLRYRLYEIDVIASRSIAYGVLSLFVVGTYVFVVGYLGALFQAGGNIAISLVATGVVALLFQPVRVRLQRGADHIVYGRRREPYTILSELSSRLRANSNLENALAVVADTVGRLLKLRFVEIRVEIDAETRQPAVFGRRGGGPLLALPLIVVGRRLGEMNVESGDGSGQWTEMDLALLGEIARQAGEIARSLELTASLRETNRRLLATQARLVHSREEERRRLRRDLHDGLGPSLAATNLKLGALQRLLPRDPKAADELLQQLNGDLECIVGEVRRVVRGLRPPALDELGLADAIRVTMSQHLTGVSVAVVAWDRLPPIPAATETAAFRICQEAITNVARHAHATECTVTMRVTSGKGGDSDLWIEVADDGVGIRSASRGGVGIRSMQERATELGGDCTFETNGSAGTKVVARLPIVESHEAHV